VVFSVEIPGWVAAIPLSLGLGIATYLNFRFTPPAPQRRWMFVIFAGMLFYYLAISACEVEPYVPPANVVPFVSAGNYVAV
jgi:hypothetical protein